MSQARLDRLASDLGDLLSRQDRRAGLPDLRKYKDDPCGFARDVLGFEPYPKQAEILEAMVTHKRLECHGANGTVKDAAAGVAALWWTFTRDDPLTVIQSSTQRQVTEVNFGREIGPLWRRAGLPGELYREALRLDGRTVIIGMTSSDSSKLTGFHGPEILVILSEAQGIESFAWEAAFACATGESDVILAVGNPLSPSGVFYQANQSPDWYSVEISSLDHPNLQEGRTVIPGGPSQQFVETMASMYGRGSPIFEARVEGRFPSESMYGLVRRSWLEAAAERWEAGELDNGGAVVIGIDVARFGPDATCLAVRRGNHLLELIKWYGADTTQTTERVKAEAARFEVHPLRHDFAGRAFPATGRLVCDSIGIGAGVADQLRKADYTVGDFNGATRARKADDFMNKRAESFWHIRKLLEDGKVAVPHDEDLWQELLTTEWSVDGSGRVKIEPKSDLAARLGRSPDKADALAMAFATGTDRRLRVCTHLY